MNAVGARSVVVERRVEHRLARLVRRLDPDALQFPLPRRGGVFPVAVELPAGRFTLEVPAGAIHAHRRQADLQQQRLARPQHEAEQAAGPRGLNVAPLVRISLGVADQPRLERGREPRDEEHALVLRPASREPVPRDRRRALERDPRFDRFVPLDGEPEIERHGGLTARRRPEERIPVQADAARGCELRPDVERLQVDRVVARRGLFLLVRERRHDAARHLRARLRRRHEDVAEIADPRAAQVCVTETGNLGVRVVIARGPLPALRTGIGAELNQAAGHGRARKGMTVAAGADERIDIPHKRLAGRRRHLPPRLRMGTARHPQANCRRTLQHIPPGNHRTSGRYVS